MTKGEVKRFLSNVFYIRREIIRLENKIKEFESMRERITPSYTGMPGGGGSGDKLTDITAKIIELTSRQQKKIDIYLSYYSKADKMICSLSKYPDKLSEILRLRYLEGERWERIAADLNYSWKHLFRLHDKAVKIISEKVDTK